MRPILAALLVWAAAPIHAETLSAEIGHAGLAKVEARLAALPDRSPADSFALGGVQFLRAIEISFQDRWQAGLTDRGGILPLLRIPIPPNPAPAPFDPASVTGIFTHAGTKLAEAKATLTAIPDSDYGVEIAISDLWFDVNGNDSRDTGEGVSDILGATVLGVRDGAPDGVPRALPIVRFDSADAAWIAAYADLLQAVCDMVRAYDPTEPLTRIITARARIADLGPTYPDFIFGDISSDPKTLDGVDILAVALASLQQTPDAARMTSAREHLLAMVAENRTFWIRVAAETDDAQEWLPNDHQHAALGVELPPGTQAAWLAVLSDVEAVLNGTKLLPFWRAGAPAGINLAKVFANPAPIDVAGWVQGWAALPYLQKGQVIDTTSLDAFDSLMQGQSMLFALYLN
jgi:hypothetical protein